jgi:hypothetical protein
MTTPACTAAAVTGVLAAAGFLMSVLTGRGARDRIYAAGLPLPEPRIGICWHPALVLFPLARRTALTLDEAGYQVELAGEYLELA